MKLLIIRHGDPNYEIDSLTPKGWREAELLAERISKLDIRDFYVSPLGRAKDTAATTLKKMNRTAEELPWLREFDAPIRRPDVEDKIITWDWLPKDWTEVPEYFNKDDWSSTDIMREGNVLKEYQWVTSNFDRLLTKHGYVREKNYYRVEQANTDTIVLFCHFGVECVLLSRLLNVSPMVLWHGACAAPTSVTTVVTEERRKGIAYFRMSSFGDISHLYVADEIPSKAARFCETYDEFDERHD